MKKLFAVLLILTVFVASSVSALNRDEALRAEYEALLSRIEDAIANIRINGHSILKRLHHPADAAPSDIVSFGDYDCLINDGTASIAKYTGDADAITIPSKINEYQVTAIEAEAFSYRKFKSVSIPGSIRVIGKQAFEYCEITQSLRLPESVTISKEAFGYAKLPPVVTIPEGATVEECAFSYCKNMEMVCVDPDSVLKSRAFGYCDDLKTVVCADGVRLETKAFELCRNMEQAFLCGDAEAEEDAFSGCGAVEPERGGDYESLRQAIIPAHSEIDSSRGDVVRGNQSDPAAMEAQTELPPAHVPEKGEFLYLALGDEKLANIKQQPPVELSFHVDQGGYGRTATFKEGDALDKAIELLCAIRIGEESGEWVTDNYNGIRLAWKDGSHTGISLNLNSLEYSTQSALHIYRLENLDAFWTYCAGYLEEDR